MRVLEIDPSALYKMGKNKKHKIRKAKENDADDSSEDGILNGCPHVSKSVNLAAMRKTLLKPTVNVGECSGCSREPTKPGGKDLFGTLIEGPAGATADDTESGEATVCICLQCGHQGCDRNSPNKHALKHYKTPHSGLHCVIVNLTTWATWCYICDDEVAFSGKIKGCIDFLQKQSGVAKPEHAQAMSQPLDSPVAEASSPMTNTASSKNVAPISCVKVKGLSNLGNTCFFNAVMQSMCQTRGLDSLLSDRSKQGRLCPIPGVDVCVESDSSSASEDDHDEENSASKRKTLPGIQTSLGEAGQVTQALLNFIQEMKGGTTRNGIVNPTSLFSQVCKKAPRFKGFQQQDSHELLRYLVDSIRTEEIKRGQASILKFFKLPETINPKKVDDEVKMKVKEYGRQVKHTFLDSMFGGQLVSTVKCEECKSISQIFEAFLDLSLPVMEEKPQRPNLVLIGKKKDQVLGLCEGVEEGGGGGAVGGGLDLDAYADRPSKYQERKNKRLAKKDSKRKSKAQRGKSFQGNDKDEAAKISEKEEKTGGGDGHDSEGGSEEGVRNGLDSAEATPDSPRAEDGCHGLTLTTGSQRRQIQSVSRPQSSNTSMDSAVDSGQRDRGGGHDHDKSAGHSDTDDPSDADVEDNLESDMSRVGSSFLPNKSSQNGSSVPSISNLAAMDSSFTITTGKSGITSIEDDSINKPGPEAANGREQEISSSSVDVSATLSLDGGTNMCKPLLINGDAHIPGDNLTLQGGYGDSVCSSAQGDGLCENLSQFSLTDGHFSISCEVSVNNVEDNAENHGLTNGIAQLKLDDPETAEFTVGGDTEKDSGIVMIDKTCSHSSFDISKETEESPENPQVSATFTVTLPQQIVDANNGREESGDKDDGGFTGLAAGSHSPRQEVRDTSRVEKEEEQGRKDVQDSKTSAGQQTLTGSYQNCQKSQQEVLKEARGFSMNTLAPRYHPSPKECSVLSCLNQFTAAELLTGSNKFGCKECTRRRRKNSHSLKGDKKDTVYSNASKQYLIFRPPAVLTLHLKRFEQTGLTSRKVNRHVDFPLMLDLAPYCSSLCLGVKEAQSKVLYSLYAVVEHSGRLSGGHYTAYIKVRPGLTSPTQFLHTQPPSPLDLLNVYLTRVLKSKEGERRDEECVVDKAAEIGAVSLLPPGRWFHISDSRVSEVTEAMVLKAQAYLLFYERIF